MSLRKRKAYLQAKSYGPVGRDRRRQKLFTMLYLTEVCQAYHLDYEGSMALFDDVYELVRKPWRIGAFSVAKRRATNVNA